MRKVRNLDASTRIMLIAAKYWSMKREYDRAIGVLLEDLKATSVIAGGRPSWAPPRRSTASLKLILGGRYMSKADVLAKYKPKC